jgi:hypothetical protein
MKTQKSFTSTIIDNVVAVLSAPFTHEAESPKKATKPKPVAKQAVKASATAVKKETKTATKAVKKTAPAKTAAKPAAKKKA